MRFFFFLIALACAIHAADKPNIVFILADDLGINDLSCYGRKDQSTPNLDRLAAQGVRFTSAYCAQPICSPSRAALLTGKHPARLHLTSYLPGRADAPSQKLKQPMIEGQLPLEEVTLAEHLRGQGYATACFGKWHLGGAGFGPGQQGFDHVVKGSVNTKPSATEGSKGEYALTHEAERWMESVKERPFFLYLPHDTPHIPFAATEEDQQKHADAFNPTYAAVIDHMDRCVGRIMDKLEALSLTDRTVFIFASDNGGLHVLESPGTPATHNTPFRAGKGFVYEGGLRVPLIVRWPGKVKPAWVSDVPVVLTDLFPTLLEAAGIDVAKAAGPLDGVALTGFLGGSDLAARPLFWHFPHYTNQGGRPAGALREGQWKLIENYEDGSLELYDLTGDIGEAKDRAQQEPERVRAMKATFDRWMNRIGADRVVTNPDFSTEQHRALYIDRDPSKLVVAKTSKETENEWKPWRAAMNKAAKGNKPAITPARGDIRLHAKDAKVHGKQLRYESEPHKNTLGAWSKISDWVSWDFEVAKAGKYAIEVQYGWGEEGTGANIAVEVGGTIVPFQVTETGHFQHFVQRVIGQVDLIAGPQTLTVKPQSKPGKHVMDLRRVVLRPL